MPISDFYAISDLQQGESSIKCSISFFPEHSIFAGHFPGQPVVPGVCMMQIVKDILQARLQNRLLLRTTGQVKFLQLLTPDIAPQVNISWQQIDNAYLVNAVFRNLTDVFKLNGTYEIV